MSSVFGLDVFLYFSSNMIGSYYLVLKLGLAVLIHSSIGNYTVISLKLTAVFLLLYIKFMLLVILLGLFGMSNSDLADTELKKSSSTDSFN